jgi:Mg2+ and Co2+ transporter CorA
MVYHKGGSMDLPEQMAILSQQQIEADKGEEPDPKKEWREKVNLILPDELMIFLAFLMIPIVVIPLVFDLPASLDTSFNYADDVMLGVFVIEYFLKALLAKDIRKHVLNPWHLLDLLVVVLPVLDFLQLFVDGLGRTSPLLRLFRVARIVAVGSRAVDRRIKQRSYPVMETPLKVPMSVRIMNRDMETIQQGASLDRIREYSRGESHSWIDISSVSESNFEELSTALGVPRLLLESELIEESYPRVDFFEHYSMIFARIADIRLVARGTQRLFVNRAGLLVMCSGQNIITISKAQTSLFSQILEKAKKYHTHEEPLAVSILYTVLKYALEKDSQIITALEQELIALEKIPLQERPPHFLETTFHLRKEVNQLVPSLLHMKEIAAIITSRRVHLEGFNEKHERLFDILMDEATYLHETAENARDNLLSLIDLYINTTSFELSRVMRIVAVITCLGIIPAVMGLLGSNLVGNPWNIELWQVFLWLGLLMLAMGWVFYRLGWLK